SNDKLRQTMSVRARQKVIQNFAWPVIIKKYEELWSELFLQKSSESEEKREPYLYMDYYNNFASYPTEILLPDRQVKITENGKAFLQKNYSLNYYPESGFYQEQTIVRRIC